MKGLQQFILISVCLLSLGNSMAKAGVVVPLDRIIAVVNNNAITESDLDNRMKAVYHQLTSQNITVPPEENLRSQVLKQLILEDIQLQIAKRSGIIIDNSMLNNAVKKIAQRYNLTVPEFKEKLKTEGLSFSEARNTIHRDMILNRVRQRMVAQRIHISNQEVDNYLNSPEGKSQNQTEYRLGHILIAIPDKADAKEINTAKEKAESIVTKLRKGANFPEMAVTFSQGQNALKGGDIGWRKADQLPTLFAKEALKMEKGQVSNPVRSQNGFHIFKLLDTRGNEKHIQEQVHIRQILVEPNQIRNNLETKMLAMDLYNRLRKGESFSDLAKAYSNDTTSSLNGGDLNWVSPATLPSKLQDVIRHIPLNTVSKPFQSNYGWHIVEVLGKRKSDISEEVHRNQVRELLGNRKLEEELGIWLREIRAQAYVEIFPK